MEWEGKTEKRGKMPGAPGFLILAMRLPLWVALLFAHFAKGGYHDC